MYVCVNVVHNLECYVLCDWVLSDEHIDVLENFWSFTVCKTGKIK